MKLTSKQQMEILMIGERISTLIDEEAEDWASAQMQKEGVDQSATDLLDRHHELVVGFRDYLIKSVF